MSGPRAPLLGLRPILMMSAEERAAVTGWRGRPFDVAGTLSMLDALDGIAELLKRAEGVVGLIPRGAEGDSHIANAAVAAAESIAEARALLGVLEHGIRAADVPVGLAR